MLKTIKTICGLFAVGTVALGARVLYLKGREDAIRDLQGDDQEENLEQDTPELNS